MPTVVFTTSLLVFTASLLGVTFISHYLLTLTIRFVGFTFSCWGCLRRQLWGIPLHTYYRRDWVGAGWLTGWLARPGAPFSVNKRSHRLGYPEGRMAPTFEPPSLWH